MPAIFRSDRAFEQALGEPAGEPGAGEARQNGQFQRILDLRLEHEYYNGGQSSGHDFIILPTADTQDLIRDLGLLLKIGSDGLSLAVEGGRRRGLLDYIAQRRAGGDFWSRMAFTVSVKNPQFFNITHLPLSFDCQRQNIYITNQYLESPAAADEAAERPRLALYALPIRPLRSTVEVPAGGGVCIRNEAGQVVYPPPTPVPGRALADRGEAVGAAAAAERRDTLSLSLSALPEDKYRLQILDAQGQAIEDRGWFLFTTASQAPLLFLDVLFLPPTSTVWGSRVASSATLDVEPGCYPLRTLSTGGAEGGKAASDLQLGSARCRVVFPARRTRWVYFIVPPPGSRRLTHLRIEEVSEGPSPPAQPSVTFSSLGEQRLPDGRLAYALVSEPSLPLQQVARIRLRLHGTVAGAAGSRVLLERLPVASPAMVYSQATPTLGGVEGMVASAVERSPAALAGRPPLLSWQVPRETFSHIHVYL